MKGTNQLITGFTGSFENITAVSSPDGKTILKGKITQMTNPNSEGQQFTRGRFTQIREVAALLAKFAPYTYKKHKVTHSEYNSRTSHGMVVSKEMDPFTLADLLEEWNFTRGDAYALNVEHESESTEDNEDGTWSVSVEWDYDAENPAQEGTDIVKILLFNPDTQYVAVLNTPSNPTARSIGLAGFVVPVPVSGTTYITVFAQSADGVLVSTETAHATLDSEGTFALID